MKELDCLALSYFCLWWATCVANSLYLLPLVSFYYAAKLIQVSVAIGSLVTN